METIMFQVSTKEKIPFILELLSHFDFIENVTLNKENKIENEPEDIPDEIKELLKQRIEKYNKAPENVKTWDAIEQRLLEKYKHEI